MTGDNTILVLFDGVCNLCNGAVQFIIKRDPEGIFKFASLQSEFGQAQLKKFGLSTTDLHSIIVVDNNQCYQRSDAAIKMASKLKGGWSLISLGRFFPRFIRDALYNLVAANRYRLFGKQEACLLPTPELRERFVQ